MTSSEEEGEILPDWVTDYEFFNQQNEYVSFASLPLAWGKNCAVDNSSPRMYLSATCKEGLQKIYKQVIAWRYELSYTVAEISLLCKGNHWVKIVKPKKQFQAAVRSILITIQCLHYVKRNPEASEEAMWLYMERAFSMYESAPSEADCMDHSALIRVAAEHDNDLASSKFILGILSEQHPKEKALHMEDLPLKRDEFIVDDDVDYSSELDELRNEEEELFDTCCSICDNGGDILCCEGRCMRSFHGTTASGEGMCLSLGLSESQVNALPNFFCQNCQYQQHQCFICGQLGSSDISSNAEVFPCVSANCGSFYHPKCVAAQLMKQNDTQMEDFEEKIAAGESFVCPAHRCFVCKQVEDRKVEDMQFAVCRRCPRSYHRKCLPREICFENDPENGIFQRAWDDLLPKRVLIYCLDHEIIPNLGTPRRNHLRFPGSSEEKIVGHGKRKLMPSQFTVENGLQKTIKEAKKVGFSSRESAPARIAGKGISRPASDALKKAGFSNSMSGKKGYVSSSGTEGRKVFQKNKVSCEINPMVYSQKSGNVDLLCKKLNTVGPVLPIKSRKDCSSPLTDSEEKRILALMKDVESSFDVEEFKRKQKVPDMYGSSQDVLDKTLTTGKVDVAVKALQTALQKLKNGGTVDDAKAVCGPEVLRQIPVWKKKIEVYLGPFLHGTRYTSYGRHFTNSEKLQEIVDRLHWYVQDGDTIVDFCCGANEFSPLMKEKLDGMGKTRCQFKNYDLFPPKENFNFEQKNWFHVTSKELPLGSRLIMGLNPPFGVKGALANKFIHKALKFNPKLVILIVPPETRRLDTSYGNRYDLIWEDRHLLSGKSFYLPGSFDIHDKQVQQWNNTPPPLSLWSRSDWTQAHQQIAVSCGHSLPPPPQIPPPPPPPPPQLLLPPPPPPQPHTSNWNYLMEDQHDCYGNFSKLDNEYGADVSRVLDDIPVRHDGFVPCPRGQPPISNYDNRGMNVSPPAYDLEDMQRRFIS